MGATAAGAPLMFLEQLQGSQNNAGTHGSVYFHVVAESSFLEPAGDLKQIAHHALRQLAQRLRRVLATGVLVGTDQIEKHNWKYRFALTGEDVVELAVERRLAAHEQARDILQLDRARIVFLEVSLSVVKTIHDLEEAVQSARTARTGAHRVFHLLTNSVITDGVIQHTQSLFYICESEKQQNVNELATEIISKNFASQIAL